MPASVTGAARLDRALAKMAEDATDRAVHQAAGELILVRAKRKSRSRRVKTTGRVTATGGRARIMFGSLKVPWTAPSHFGHGSRTRPRAQGGWMKANPFLFDARDESVDEIVDLVLRRTKDAIRANGLG
jgi:hypothetical protein